MGIHRWVVLLCGAAVVSAADWPPALDRANTVTRSLDGRSIERYTHGPRDVWGYSPDDPDGWAYRPAGESAKAGQNHNSFYVLAPRKPRKHAPLCVVLHSANRTAYDYLAYQALDRRIDGGDDPATVDTHTSDDCYGLFLSSTNAEWYGWSAARRESAKYSSTPTPAEKRILDTIEWVVRQYKIDRNRIYLTGVSMGGCGTLGLGLPHGEVFAAIAAFVPAGTEYAALRRGLPPPLAEGASPADREKWIQQISGFGLPDPPVLVDFSAQNDNWSKTQPALLEAAEMGHLPLILGWGLFGHTTFRSRIAKFPPSDVALAFPWMEIRKDSAYPVFTHSTSDQHPPWRNASAGFDESGQLNAYFRWKSEQDQPSQLVMRLWIAHPTVSNPPPMPDASTTDVTLRRLQRFEVQAGRTYDWRLVRDSKSVSSGQVTPDAANLLTIPGVTLTTEAAELSVSLAKQAAGPPATAWNPGYPQKGLKNAAEFVSTFKNKAQHLGKDGKLRILVIGDSLSDGSYHWSHHFRKDLQEVYGNGGSGAVWATFAGDSAQHGAMPGWLWSEKDFVSYKGPGGRWRNGYGSRGDIWPYLGWNGTFLTTSDARSSYEFDGNGSRFTVVYSTGTFTSFDGEQITNHSAGFTVSFDGRKKVIAPAAAGEPLDIGLEKFEAADGRHELRIDSIHSGDLWLHGVIVENSAPGVIVYNVSRGGYWAHDFLWRQPGWEKILKAFQPDYTVIFLTKPESGGSGPVGNTNRLYEYERLMGRVIGAVPGTQTVFFKCWDPRDGISPADAQTWKERTTWFESKKLPYLDLQAGLDRLKMKDLDWFKDNIHLTPAGGKGIGGPIARMFLP